MMYFGTDYEDTVLVVTIWGHLGPFGGQSETPVQEVGIWFYANFTLFSGQKWPEIPQIMYFGTDYEHIVLVGTIGGHLGAI